MAVRQSIAVTRTCETCGKPFTVIPSRAKQGKGRFCSVICRSGDLRSRFLSSVGDPLPNGCMPWLKSVSTCGYGCFYYRGRQYIAPRVAYELANGEIPKGLHVLHSCDNPICCNPDHLHLGTHAQNMSEMGERGRASKDGAPKGEENGQATLTAKDVQAIRQRRAAGESYKAIAADFGIGQATVGKIVNRERWNHV